MHSKSYHYYSLLCLESFLLILNIYPIHFKTTIINTTYQQLLTTQTNVHDFLQIIHKSINSFSRINVFGQILNTKATTSINTINETITTTNQIINSLTIALNGTSQFLIDVQSKLVLFNDIDVDMGFVDKMMQIQSDLQSLLIEMKLIQIRLIGNSLDVNAFFSALESINVNIQLLLPYCTELINTYDKVLNVFTIVTPKTQIFQSTWNLICLIMSYGLTTVMVTSIGTLLYFSTTHQ